MAEKIPIKLESYDFTKIIIAVLVILITIGILLTPYVQNN